MTDKLILPWYKVETALVPEPESPLLSIEQAVAAPAELAEAETRFTLGTWAGHTQWKCARCPFDTLKGKAEMLAHWQEKHEPKPEPAAERVVQAYSASGKPIDV